MENQQSSASMFENFTWKVENFTQLATVDMLYSIPVTLCGYRWRILMYPYGNNDDCISLYLDSMQSYNLDQGRMGQVTFRLTIFNQLYGNMSVTKEAYHIFTEREKECGFRSFMPLFLLHNPHLGFLVNDACIVGVEVCVHNSRQSNQVNQTANIASSLTFEGPSSGHMVVPREVERQVLNLDYLFEFSPPVHIEPTEHVDVELFSGSTSELLDFRGLGQVEKSFVPLLEEVCSRYPSLIESQRNKTRKFTEWAFTALGRVLYFLKTKKAKDMDGQACKDLRTLWEELQTCRFDLSWLEPHIQSAFEMKSHVEKTLEIEKLKENIASLEFEKYMLKTQLTVAEENFNTELGYGIP